MKKRDPVLVAFGRSVRSRREAKNITQRALAEMAGIHRTYLCEVEGGARNVALKIIVRIARALEISPAQLMEGVRWSKVTYPPHFRLTSARSISKLAHRKQCPNRSV
jgi:transcriptional regulator with XRE-family HTH domain